MMTVRFPNGFSLQYNTACYCKYLTSGARELYTKDPADGGRWIATVPAACVIEIQRPCRAYDATREPEELGTAALEAIERHELSGYHLARIKVALQGFDARRRCWK